MWTLSFISKENFLKHVLDTITHYKDVQQPYDLARFNQNIIDPVKLLFDKSVYGLSWDDIVKLEIARQRDKSNNNDIGYFHQRFFQYVANCEVPANGHKGGWDVIVEFPKGLSIGDSGFAATVSKVYVEMKNKHNTMNSSGAAKTYIKMQHQLLEDDKCACFLVEAIAKCSQNIKWKTTVDGKRVEHNLIRRVSIDEFYKLVTGQEDAFYQMCMVLPKVIEEALGANPTAVSHDSVIDELRQQAKIKNISMEMAAFLLGFSTYYGFRNL